MVEGLRALVGFTVSRMGEATSAIDVSGERDVIVRLRALRPLQPSSSSRIELRALRFATIFFSSTPADVLRQAALRLHYD
jgi:hypothetical protein